MLDGAMGTMIQRHKLTEADFRGERFAIHPQDLQGQQRPAGPDAPGRHPRHPSRVPRGRRRHHRDEHVQRHAIAQADYGLEPLVYELNVEGAAAGARRRPTRGPRRRPDQPRFVAGSMGPTNRTLSISPDVNDPAFRATTFDEMRDAPTRTGARPDRRRLPTCCCSRRSSTR